MVDKTKPAKGAAKSGGSFSAEERAAMQERVAEEKAERKRGGKAADGEADVLAKIAEMDAADRALAEGLHAIVRANAPQLSAKTWYGMPAYANGDGKIVCFFQPAGKFKARYSTLGFNDAARLDDGQMWPTAYALIALDAEQEKRIAALIRQAAG